VPQGDAAQSPGWIGGNRITDCRQHRHISRAVRECARRLEIDPLLSGVFSNRHGFLIPCEYWPKHMAGSDMVFELQIVANHLFDTEVQRNRTECEIRRSRHKDVPIAETPRLI